MAFTTGLNLCVPPHEQCAKAKIQAVIQVLKRLYIMFFAKKICRMIFCTNEEGNELVIYFFFFSFSCQPARETFKYGMVVSYYLVLYHHDLPAEELYIDVAFYQSIRCCYYVSFYGIVWQGELQG